MSNYINSFEELIQRCELVEDPSFTIARFIPGLQPDLKHDLTLSSPFILDEAYHKALDVEKLNKPVPVRRPTFSTRPSIQVASKAAQFLAGASNAKAFSLPVSSNSPLSASSFQIPTDKVMQCVSCRGRGHYASECPHRTLALGHEPVDCEEEIVAPEGSYEDFIDVENSVLQGDSHLGVVRCLLSNPIASEEWKRTTIFYTLARLGDTLMKLVIDRGSTMNVVA